MSNKIKKLQELTIEHNFMFCAVMMDPEICRLFQERALDMQIARVEAGCEYRDLPNEYVIFICDFDPFGEKKYRHNCATYCKETGKRIEDGRRTVFLSTVGKNPEEVPKELMKFLDFVHAGLEDSEKDWDDTYIQSLQKRVSEIKVSRKMGGAYMRYSALMQDERRIYRGFTVFSFESACSQGFYYGEE